MLEEQGLRDFRRLRDLLRGRAREALAREERQRRIDDSAPASLAVEAKPREWRSGHEAGPLIDRRHPPSVSRSCRGGIDTGVYQMVKCARSRRVSGHLPRVKRHFCQDYREPTPKADTWQVLRLGAPRRPRMEYFYSLNQLVDLSRAEVRSIARRRTRGGSPA